MIPELALTRGNIALTNVIEKLLQMIDLDVRVNLGLFGGREALIWGLTLGNNWLINNNLRLERLVLGGTTRVLERWFRMMRMLSTWSQGGILKVQVIIHYKIKLWGNTFSRRSLANCWSSLTVWYICTVLRSILLFFGKALAAITHFIINKSQD